MLEEYQSQLAVSRGVRREIVGAAHVVSRATSQTPRVKSDFLRLVGDIVMARQSEDTFKTSVRREDDGLTGRCRRSATSVSGTGCLRKEANRLAAAHVRRDAQGIDRVAAQSAEIQAQRSFDSMR